MVDKVPSLRILVTGSRDWGVQAHILGDRVEGNILRTAMWEFVGRSADQISPLPEPSLGGEVLQRPYHEITLVHGGCRTGVDAMVKSMFADRFNEVIGNQYMKQEIHEAEWDKYGNSAGPIRNAAMVNLGADICLAFIKNNSDGATNCATLAKAARIPTYIFRSDPPKAWQVKK